MKKAFLMLLASAFAPVLSHGITAGLSTGTLASNEGENASTQSKADALFESMAGQMDPFRSFGDHTSMHT